jgi:NADPH-dependent curcumin reductase CurA
MGPLCAQTIATLPDIMLQPIDEKRAPITAYLGVLGMTTGLTAYFGIREVGHVKPGETVVVSAAAGAVGSLAGQIARLDGARVIGIAGGPDKCRHLTKELGFDAAVDYKGEDVDARLRELAPEGIDVYFDNVGGEMLDIVLDQIREQARVVICGAISQYHGDMSKGVRGPNLYLRLAERHARMEGYAVSHFAAQFGPAEAQLAEWLASGALRLPEQVEHGIENFGATLQMLFDGGNTGKLLLAV